MREIASVILFAVVAVMSATLYQSANAMELDKQAVAEEQLSRLNQMYKGLDAYCDAAPKAYHVDLATVCKAQKVRIKEEFAGRIESIIQKRLIDGEAKIKADAIEAQCLQDARALAESLNVSYDVADTCAQVKAKIGQGSGSGSGGQ